MPISKLGAVSSDILPFAELIVMQWACSSFCVLAFQICVLNEKIIRNF